MLETPSSPRTVGDPEVDAAGGSGAAAPDAAPVLRRATLRHEPALDGLRGIAVAAVLLYHGAIADRIEALLPWTRGGFLGVSAFFTLSGFLICSLLVVEHRSSGGVSLRGFWSRRFRRLMPASLLLLGAVVVLTPLVGTESQLVGLRGDVWAALAYVINWHFIISGNDYAAQFAGAPSPLQHLWSLSIEEQWYLIVPVVAAVALKVRRFGPIDRTRWIGGRRLFGRIVLAGAVASVALQFLLGDGGYSNRVYMGTDTRFAEMAIGALLAVALAGRFTLSPTARRAVVALGPVVLAVLLVLWARTPLTASWLYRGGLAVHAMLVAVVILAAVQSGGPVRRVLGVAPLVSLGRISYGVYLFHWPIMWWVTPERLHLGPTASFVVQVGLTLTVATVSFRVLESPVRHGRRITGWRRPVVVAAAIVAVAVGALLLPSADPAAIIAVGNNPRLVVPTTPSAGAPSAPGSPAASSVAPAGASGAESADAAVSGTPPATAPLPPLKVMVVGDSYADSIVMGLQRWALTTGKMAVLDATITGCGFGRGGRNKGVGFNRQWTAECQARDRTMIQDLADFRPDLVLMAGGMWDVTDRLVPGIGRWTHIGDPEYDTYLVGELRHVADLAGSQGASVVWADSPHWNPVPGSVIYMGKPPYPEADPVRADRFNELLTLALADRADTRILDLAGWMRTQPGGELDPALRVDGVHFTEASTDTVAAWLGPQLLAGAGRS